MEYPDLIIIALGARSAGIFHEVVSFILPQDVDFLFFALRRTGIFSFYLRLGF
jgi:hypothetical protein